ncbi:MAG: Outer membrane efflux protein [candidate division BRC1 bacterium ADurb.BinA364]|nr:MAG: Outer membrane efflux protein [candidate division BRC1 bacterium ADurb.BinA364]
MLDFGYPLRESEMEIAPMLWRIGLSQPIPWWRKLWAAQRMAALEADMARLAYETALLETIAQTKESYYELYYLDRAIPIAAKAEEIFRNQATLAYGELSAGRSELNEAFRAESQAAQLEYDRLLLGEQRFAQAEGFKALLNLPSGARVGPIRSAPAYPVSPSFEELAARAERYARELQSMGLDARRAAYESYLARLARIPDLTLGLDLAKMGEMTPGFMDMFESKGKNPIEGAIGLELPIWEWRNRALEREKEALREAMEREAMGETNRLRAAVAAAWYRVRLAERLVALYENTLLPQADAAMRQAEAQYRAQLASLATVLESTLAWQNFQLALERARADRGQALVALERAIGTTAEARPAEEARP